MTGRRLLTTIDTSLARYDLARTEAFYRELGERVASIPGVETAALTSSVPAQPGRRRDRQHRARGVSSFLMATSSLSVATARCRRALPEDIRHRRREWTRFHQRRQRRGAPCGNRERRDGRALLAGSGSAGANGSARGFGRVGRDRRRGRRCEVPPVRASLDTVRLSCRASDPRRVAPPWSWPRRTTRRASPAPCALQSSASIGTCRCWRCGRWRISLPQVRT